MKKNLFVLLTLFMIGTAFIGNASSYLKTSHQIRLPEVDGVAPPLGRFAKSHHLGFITLPDGCVMNLLLPLWIPSSPKGKLKIKMKNKPNQYQISVFYSDKKHFLLISGGGAYRDKGWELPGQVIYLGSRITGYLTNTQSPPLYTLAWLHKGWYFRVSSRTEGEVIQKSEALLRKTLNTNLPPDAVGADLSMTPEGKIKIDWWQDPDCGYSITGNFPLNIMLHTAHTLSPLNQKIREMDLVTKKIWYLAQGSALWLTQNSGSTWTMIRNFNSPILRICSLPDRSILIGLLGGKLVRIKTKDKKWKEIHTSIMNAAEGPWKIKKTLFVLTNVWTAVPNLSPDMRGNSLPENKKLLMESKNNGKTWNPAAFIPIQFQNKKGGISWFEKLILLDSKTWAIVTSLGGGCTLPDELFISLNQGKTWNSEPMFGTKSPFKVKTITKFKDKTWFIGGNVCAESGEPAFFFTKDRGYHVYPIPLPAAIPNPEIQKIIFLSSKLGIAVGSQHTGYGVRPSFKKDLILKTNNGGKTWMNISRPEFPGLFTIFCTKSYSCMAVSPDPDKPILRFNPNFPIK